MREVVRLDFSIRGGTPVMLLSGAFLLAAAAAVSSWYALLEIDRWVRAAFPDKASWADSILIALAIGIAIGYVAFSPDMDTTRKDLWIKANALIDSGRTNSSK